MIMMITLEINRKKIKVKQNTTLLEAARKLSIPIPTLCSKEGYRPFTSCMVCLVKEKTTGRLLPSCSVRAEEGMIIETDCEDVYHARKTALELLLSDHIGDCEGPCQRICPANMNIPLMIEQIETGEFKKALITVKQHIPLPAVLGRICSAPCEKGCRRGLVDHAVSICVLKRFVADLDLASHAPYLPPCKPASGKKAAIIGTGPTGLSAAYYLIQQGHTCTLFDDHPKPGGMLRYGVSEIILPRNILDAEINVIKKMGAVFKTNRVIGKDYSTEKLKSKFDTVILATGSSHPEFLPTYGVDTTKSGISVNTQTYETSTKGIFAGGGAIRSTKMAVKAVAHGRSIAFSANQFLRDQEIKGPSMRFNSCIGKLKNGEPDKFLQYHKNIRAACPETKLPHVANKKNDITPAQAVMESKRCLHCECLKQVTCKLREYADAYDVKPQIYKRDERMEVQKELTHPKVIYEPGKCIKCGICVRITEQHQERFGLTFIGRGFDVRIDVPLNQTLKTALETVAKQCAEACPTAALSLRRCAIIEK